MSSDSVIRIKKTGIPYIYRKGDIYFEYRPIKLFNGISELSIESTFGCYQFIFLRGSGSHLKVYMDGELINKEHGYVIKKPIFMFLSDGSSCHVEGTLPLSGYLIKVSVNSFLNTFNYKELSFSDFLRDNCFIEFSDDSSFLKNAILSSLKVFEAGEDRISTVAYENINSFLFSLLLQVSVDSRINAVCPPRLRSRKEEIFERFNGLVKADAAKCRDVDAYANRLGVSSSQLRRVCQEVKSKTPLEMISDRVITLAQEYMQTSCLSIQEVAYRLGYNDAAYFTRFFRKNTGLSPSEYRKRFFE